MILLDTQAVIWWAQDQPSRLSPRARREIAKAEKNQALFASAMSIWETCLLVKSERIQLGVTIQKWIDALTSLPELHIIPIDTEIARSSVYLPEPFHKDPADRMIVATALSLGAPIVTSDCKIREYKHVRTIW